MLKMRPSLNHLHARHPQKFTLGGTLDSIKSKDKNLACCVLLFVYILLFYSSKNFSKTWTKEKFRSLKLEDLKIFF